MSQELKIKRMSDFAKLSPEEIAASIAEKKAAHKTKLDGITDSPELKQQAKRIAVRKKIMYAMCI